MPEPESALVIRPVAAGDAAAIAAIYNHYVRETTVTFEEHDGRTLVVLRELYPSKEAFEAGAGAEEAMPEQFAQLDELLLGLK